MRGKRAQGKVPREKMVGKNIAGEIKFLGKKVSREKKGPGKKGLGKKLH